VLIVDDDKLVRWVLENNLTRWGYDPACATGVEDALVQIRLFPPDLILLDQRLPDGTGLDMLEQLSTLAPHPEVILLTAFDRTDVAVKAMKLGAADYLSKPVNIEELKVAVDRVFESIRLRRQLDLIQEEQSKLLGGWDIIGTSGAMQRVYEFVNKVAKVGSSTVLVSGETGTGKELVARRIHKLSARGERAFVAVNCSTMSETLLESELFGHEKGAFTDAVALNRGLLEAVDGGTLFLDEIGGMDPAVQVKLLRVFEEKKARRIGSTRDYSVDVRIIAATNQSLKKAMEAGKFRSDLYYRLNVASVTLPPLRARGDDVVLLAEHFRVEFNQVCRKEFKGFLPGVKEAFLRHSWPGNVRELRNTIERAVILEDGENLRCQLHERQYVHPDVDEKGNLLVPVGPTGISFAELEKQTIILAMRAASQNQSEAARLLQISRDTLRYRLKKYGIEARQEQGGERGR
jgi:DNA-binding NtrC family response regulator